MTTPGQAAEIIRALAKSPNLPAEVLVSYAAQVAADVSEPDPVPVVASDRGMQVGARDALLTVLTSLDQWVKDVRANNAARQIISDPGEEFVMYPADVRYLIAAVARELGVTL